MSNFLKVLLLFFMVFDLSFLTIPSLSTGKIAILILLLYVLLTGSRKFKIKKIELIIYILYFFIFGYLIVSYLFNGMPDTLMITRMLYYLIYSVLASLICESFFENKDEFINVYATVMFVQSIFVIISWFSVEYRELISQLLVQSGNISFLSSKRPPGLMNSAGAKASVFLAIGAAFSLYQLSSSRNSLSLIKNALYLIVNLVAVFIIGRTGLLLFMVLGVSIIIPRLKTFIFNQRFLMLLALSIFIAFIGSRLIPESFYQIITEKSDWVFGIFETGILESASVEDLKSQSILNLNLHTLLGTSQIRLDGGQHDSGYIQSYHAMGLFVSILYYVLLIFHILILLKNEDVFLKTNKLFILTLIIGFFVVEIKEPFAFSYIYPFVIFTLIRTPTIQRNCKIIT